MRLEEKLTVLRKEKGFTQSDIAEAVNVSRQAVSKWETGKAIPTTENLRCMGELYGVSVDFLLNDETETVKEAERGSCELPVCSGGFSGRADRIPQKWKYITAVLVLTALLFGFGIGVFVGIYSERHISIADIPGEEVEIDPTGEFDLGTWW